MNTGMRDQDIPQMPHQVGDSHSLDIPSADVMSQVYFTEVRTMRSSDEREYTD